MNIGIIIGRIGGIDGVALETEKWIEVFNRLGHKTYIIAGQFQERKLNSVNETLVPEMSFFSPESYWEQKKAFHHPEANLNDLAEHIEYYANTIHNSIVDWVHEYKLDVLISENASALPAHISMGLGVKRAAEKLGIPIITHDHDFAWERGERYKSPHPEITKFVDEIFPLRLPNSFHAVINLHGQTTIKERFGRDSIVVPNVMDFDYKFGVLDNHNLSLKKDFGLNENDIILSQVTRIVRRKGIEVAIDLIHKLNNKNIKLLITGSHADDEGSLYYNELVDQIHDQKLSRQIIFGDHLINNTGIDTKITNMYSLSDAYANSTACTYFSTYEGFGNAFVESVLSKTAIFVNNYKPVYMPDIGSKGFKTVMLEDNNLTDTAVKDMSEIIFNKKLNKEIADYNFDLGKKYFSYDTLQDKLEQLLEWASNYGK